MPENKRRFKVKIANEVYTIIGKAEPDHMACCQDRGRTIGGDQGIDAVIE